MPVVPCFGCTRWDGGWHYRGYPEGSKAEATEERVWIHATDFSKRKVRYVVGTEEHDSSGRRWFRPKKLKGCEIHPCTVCGYIYDNDNWFKEMLSKLASGIAGGESQ